MKVFKSITLLAVFLFASLLTLYAAVPLIVSSHSIEAEEVRVTSPDGLVQVLVSATNGPLSYEVTYKGKPVLDKSGLGLVTEKQELGANVVLGKAETYSINETYPWRGNHSKATNYCNGSKISLGQDAVLDIRVFNDGIAMRYVLASQGQQVVNQDRTSFSIPAGSTVWSQKNIKYYEAKYEKKKIEEVQTGELAGPPLTIQLPEGRGFAAITEGGLVNFAGMSLIADGNRGFQANLTGSTTLQGKIESPWRIVMIGPDLNALVNCDIVHNVSPPMDAQLFPKGYDTEWLKPGRCGWSWLAGKSVTLDNMKSFSKLAGELGFEYNLVDEGWGHWKTDTKDHWDLIKELVDYSKPLGVKIWVWKAYPDRKGIPGIKDAAQRRAFFKKCKEIGIVGLKIDFFDSESQSIIDFYQSALRDAAEFSLMINFHGSNKPTGESRTWPNEMTREAVRGLENRPPWAEQNTVQPFTRYLAGHADFTPLHFGDRLGETSWAHQVATMAIYTSPLLCVGANPADILTNPLREIITAIPTTWDETIALPASEIGEVAAFARRKGKTWYLAVTNGTKARQLEIDLSFLGKGTYKATLASDDLEKQASAKMEQQKIDGKKQKTLSVNLREGGGFIGRFEK